MACSHQAWGRGRGEQEAAGPVSEAWLASQIAPGSAANPRGTRHPPSPSSSQPIRGESGGGGGGCGGWRQCKGSTSEVMVLAWGMGREGRGSEESRASGRVTLAHVGRVWVALAYPERRSSLLAHMLKTKQKHTKTNTHTHTGSSACSS